MSLDEKNRDNHIRELNRLRAEFTAHEKEGTGKGPEQKEFNRSTLVILEAMFDGIILLNLSGQILFVNRTLEAITGYGRDELAGRDCLDFVLASTRESEFDDVTRILQGALLNELTPPFTYTHVRKDGREVPVSCTASFLRDEGGTPRALVIVYRDETDRVFKERTLRENEERFRALFEGSLDAVFLADPETGIFLDANPSACELLGMEQEEVVGMHYSRLVPERLQEEARKVYAAYQLDKGPAVPVEGQILCTDGTVKQVEILAQLIQVDARPVLHGIFRDITERKQAERARKESEAKFRSLADQSPSMIFINQGGRLVYVNRKCEEVMGYTRREFCSPDFNFMCLIAPESVPLLEENFLKQMSGLEIPPCEYRIVSKDGKMMTAIHTTKLIQFEGNQAVLGIITDITERIETEQALRESEERFRTLVEASPDAIGVTDLETRITYVSPGMVDLHGYEDAGEIEGRTVLEFIAPRDHKKIENTIRETLEKGVTKGIEYSMTRKDGSDFDAELNLSLIRDANGDPRAFMGVLRDVTERKKIEAELANTQRLESLGVLAGGIAHDFNNILSAISTNLSTAKMFGNLDEDVDEILTEAETASMRAQSLTHQLLTFAKGGLPVKKTVFLQRLLKDTVGFALRGSNVRCDYNLPAELWSIEADEGQIGQAIQNLILNADQAMPEGGVIQVRAENVVCTKGEHPTLKDGRYVKISVMDQGVGIPKKHLHKIFDPFFSTKYRGSGLGLAISHAIVTKHGGSIHVDSTVGVGTTFDVHLPASEQAPAVRGEERRGRFQGEGKILVVDDEAILRRAASKTLQRMGFSVIPAREGEEAIAIYKDALQSGEPIQAVIMDLTIPGGMGGKEAMGEILKIDPEAKVIVSSGYADDPVMAEYKTHGFSGVIKKPYRAEDLGEVLFKLLKGSR